MGWDLKRIKASGNRAKLHVTSFFGGKDTGRCLQITQHVDLKGDGNTEVQFIHLTREQAMTLVKRIKDWDSGKVSEHDPKGKLKSVFDMKEGKRLFLDEFNNVED